MSVLDPDSTLQRLRAEAAKPVPNTQVLARLALRLEQCRLEQEAIGVWKNKVQSGPFQGLLLPDLAHGSVLLPKLFGSYESELGAIWRGEAGRDAQVVIQVGCAEGYYVCGLARLYPGLERAIGIDIAETARELARRTVALNGLEARCQILDGLAAVDPDWLAGRRVLLIVDVDGAEFEVLSEALAHLPLADLAGLDLVLETDFSPDGASNREALIDWLRDNGFALLATIHQDLVRKFHPPLRNMNASTRFLVVMEGRHPDQSWLHARYAAGDGTPDGG